MMLQIRYKMWSTEMSYENISGSSSDHTALLHSRKEIESKFCSGLNPHTKSSNIVTSVTTYIHKTFP